MENLENEGMEMEVVNTGGTQSLESLKSTKESSVESFSNIKDQKKLYNLENKIDLKLNDCVNETIRVKGIVLKRIKQQLEKPIVNEETGEVKDHKFKMITILVDDQDKSYVTGSGAFTVQMMNFVRKYANEEMFEDGLEIKIIKKPTQNSSFESLGFELV